jgi:hypothetical protein
MEIPTPSKAARRIFPSLSDGPTILIDPCLKTLAGRFLGRCGSGFFRSRAARRSDQMAGPDNNLMNHSLHSVALRRELALLDGSFDE